MSNRKSKKSRKNGTALSKAYRVGIVVVHGVGNQPRGATVEHVVRRLVRHSRSWSCGPHRPSYPSERMTRAQ